MLSLGGKKNLKKGTALGRRDPDQARAPISRRRPDHCVWGERLAASGLGGAARPNDADLLELFYRYAPEPGRNGKRILVDNPAVLFGFLKRRLCLVEVAAV